MPARADLLKVADALASEAATLADAKQFCDAAGAAAQAKTALEAAQLAEEEPPGSDELAHVLGRQLDEIGEAYTSLRRGMLQLGDRFAAAGSEVATRNAELIRQMVDEADGMLPVETRS